MTKEFKLDILRVKVDSCFSVGFGGDKFRVVEGKSVKYGSMVIPEYMLELKDGTLVRKFQRSLFKLAGIPEDIDGRVIGSVAIGTVTDQEEVVISWSKKNNGLAFEAPRTSGGKRKDDGFVFNRKWFDSFGVDITPFVHAGILRIFAEVAGFEVLPLKRKGNERDDCFKCKAYRRLISSDVILGDSVEGLQVRSLSIGETVSRGPHQAKWICGFTGACPASGSIHKANKESIRGQDAEHTKSLLRNESKNIAYYCKKYVSNVHIPYESLELIHEQGRMVVAIPCGTIRLETKEGGIN